MRTYTGRLTKENMPENGIFVFGSNTEGRHGKGAALTAYKDFGAKYGVQGGRFWKSYGIVTKDLTKKTHPSVSKDFITLQIEWLYQYAIVYPNLDFYVAYSGTGKNLNGYTSEEMAEMFSNGFAIPENIIFEESFAELINKVKV